MPEEANEGEKAEMQFIPTETQYTINQEAFDKEKKELISKFGGDSLHGFDIVDSLADALILSKYKGDKKLLSPESLQELEKNIKLKDVLGFINSDMLLADFTQEHVDQIREAKNFTDDQIEFIQKAFNLKQNIFDFAKKMASQITEIQKKPQFVLGLLKEINLTLNEKDESQDIFDVYTLIEKETNKVTDPTFDLGGYIISKKIEED